MVKGFTGVDKFPGTLYLSFAGFFMRTHFSLKIVLPHSRWSLLLAICCFQAPPLHANQTVSSNHITTDSANEPVSILLAPVGGDPEEIALGKRLFHDVRLSSNNTIACSSCHILSKGGADGLSKSPGVGGQLGEMNTPTVFNSVFNVAQFWDGRAKSLEDQVAGPIHNPREMNSNWQQVLSKLAQDSGLVQQFSNVYSDGLTTTNIVQAISAYEKQLITFGAPFDRYLQGDQDAISEQAKQGYHLFKKIGCVSCHQGKNIGGNMFQVFGATLSFYKQPEKTSSAHLGRYNVTGKESDKYKFKVPSLRNVATTAPYFHDGSVEHLDEAVRIMARYQLGRPIKDNDVSSIVAFLESLTGEIGSELR